MGDLKLSGSEVSLSVTDSTLQKLIFHNDFTGLKKALQSKKYDIDAKDVHGNTPLLVSVMLARNDCTMLLLKHGADTNKKSREKWPPTAEAISVGDRDIVKAITKQYLDQMKMRVREKTRNMLKVISEMPDFYVEIEWDFHSWVPLVSRVLPHDVLKIWKKGTRLRMDSSLLDISEQNVHRGDLRFIINGDIDRDEIWMTSINSEKKQYGRQRLFQEQKSLNPEQLEEFDDDIDLMMTSDLADVDFNSREIEFTRAYSGWPGFREERSEQIGLYNTDVYQITGLNIVTRTRREHLTQADIKRNKEITKILRAGRADELEDRPDLKPPRRSLPPPDPLGMTWEEYIEADPRFPPHLGRQQLLTTKNKCFKATLWMSEEFPLPLASVVSLLTVLAPTGKHVNRLKEFVDTKLPPGFPVKLDIPLFPTVSARVTFQNYNPDPIDDDVFDIPSDFKEQQVPWSPGKSRKPKRERINSSLDEDVNEG